MIKNSYRALDKTGIIFSVACAVHCSLPLILSFLGPNLSLHFENEWIHLILLIFIIPIAIISFVVGRQEHKSNAPFALGVVGMSTLILAVTAEHLFHIHEESLEFSLTLLGSLLLVAGHIYNILLSRNKALA